MTKQNEQLIERAVELASSRVHERWMETKRSQGIASRFSETGEELMVPYGQLSEAAKDLDRNSVRATVEAITDAGLLADPELRDERNELEAEVVRLRKELAGMEKMAVQTLDFNTRQIEALHGAILHAIGRPRDTRWPGNTEAFEKLALTRANGRWTEAQP
ncbi:hypothetical protein [Amycolatopsis sp. DSM 110486]|uniref:hypothetical protein n=1 Tax=Amycolatopsis sp. DSM 110486 TaxID=2865832 RepID=UPI001C6A0015|nr:hypothetical protein [Amycolatopsis sp. DSM 110486]QYN17548.1 hypothetical protein K1T34_32705 [Amycolatopsis sp. DSM 110486]